MKQKNSFLNEIFNILFSFSNNKEILEGANTPLFPKFKLIKDLLDTSIKARDDLDGMYFYNEHTNRLIIFNTTSQKQPLNVIKAIRERLQKPCMFIVQCTCSEYSLNNYAYYDDDNPPVATKFCDFTDDSHANYEITQQKIEFEELLASDLNKTNRRSEWEDLTLWTNAEEYLSPATYLFCIIRRLQYLCDDDSIPTSSEALHERILWNNQYISQVRQKYSLYLLAQRQEATSYDAELHKQLVELDFHMIEKFSAITRQRMAIIDLEASKAITIKMVQLSQQALIPDDTNLSYRARLLKQELICFREIYVERIRLKQHYLGKYGLFGAFTAQQKFNAVDQFLKDEHLPLDSAAQQGELGKLIKAYQNELKNPVKSCTI